MKIFNKLIFWIFGIAFLVSCRDDMAPQLPEPVVETPEVGERPELKQLHVDGRNLVDADGQTVNLHGFAQTYSPFFNNNAWGNYDVDACLRYNQLMTDRVLAAGWEVNFIRQHMDPYWSSPGASTEAEAHMFYNEERFRKYLDIVFVPMAEFAISRGFYVVMRPPGVCPKEIKVGDKYQEYLVKIWDIVSEHPSLKNNPYVMFELANEPVDILNPKDGSKLDVNANKNDAFTQLSMYFQKIVDTIRENGCDNILWIPGLGYQSQYAGYVEHPINDPVNNYGFAIHVYPGWYGSDGENEDGGVGNNGGYVSFQNGWDNQVGPVAETHPIMVTEMDWAPKKYNASWGKATTGEAGGAGFGANFKLITDNSGNVSWLLFTGQEYMAEFVDVPGVEGEYTFLNDPEACPWPIYHWYQEYAGVSAEDYGNLVDIKVSGATKDKDGKYSMTVSTQGGNFYIVTTGVYDSGKERVLAGVKYDSSNTDVFTVSETGTFEVKKEGTGVLTVKYTDKAGKEWKINISVNVTDVAFLLDNSFKALADLDNACSFNEETSTLTMSGGTPIFGWGEYNPGLDLSKYKYLVVDLKEPLNANANFIVSKTIWVSPAYQIELSKTEKRNVICLGDYIEKNNSFEGTVDVTNVGVVGFQGGNSNVEIKIDKVFVSNDWPYGDDITVSELKVSGLSDGQVIPLNSKQNFTVTAVLTNGMEVNVTSIADYKLSNSSFKVEKRQIWSESETEATTNLTIKFGPEGRESTKTINNITSREPSPSDFFPLTKEGFNPSIWETGSFDETTKTLITGQYGFGGWEFTEPLDLSEYRYLVAEFDNSDGSLAGKDLQFHIFDEGYWDGAAEYYCESHNGKYIAVADLNNMYKEKDGDYVKVSSNNIKIVGFWSGGGYPIKIKSVTPTNDNPFASVSDIEAKLTSNVFVGGKTLMNVTATFDGGSTRDITFEADYSVSVSSNIDISQKGYLKGLSAGTSTVTVKFGKISEDVEVTVAEGLESLSVMNFPDKILVGKDVPFIVYGHLKDGSTEDFTTSVKYTMDADNILTVTNGVMRANTAGTVKLTMEYQGVTLEKTIEAVSNVNLFEFVGGYFNPRMTQKSRFDYETRQLTMDASDLSGWLYSSNDAVNLREYGTYLVVKLSNDSDNCHIVLSNGGYYSPYYQTSESEIKTMGDNKYIVLDISEDYTDNGWNQSGVTIYMDKITLFAIQANNSNTIITIDSVYLSDTDPTASSNGSN
ncbi:cellulase family glycosylhydrolase [Bacteroides caecigallinarum]|uniref:cellulase family glycosylhydrolase n=1 Tax=Bacteroides caecigallinarum TaxID=1411144 RepID=UPI00195A430F|nr:cellulase family glycosylhydrolase [Bacteroides caecigallinarum]MBM6865975.1 cellulase family glycosylhydrolase [Bacteroides caecigallinarum]